MAYGLFHRCRTLSSNWNNRTINEILNWPVSKPFEKSNLSKWNFSL